MTPEEILQNSVKLLAQEKAEPDVGMSNYKKVLADYKQMLNDVTVLVRELAQLWVARETASKAAATIIKKAQKK